MTQYQQRLLEAWSITEQDLEINRQGRASESQKELVRKSYARQIHAVYLALLIALILFFSMVYGLWAEAQNYLLHGNVVQAVGLVVPMMFWLLPIVAIGFYLRLLRKEHRNVDALPFRVVTGAVDVVGARGRRRHAIVFVKGAEEFEFTEARAYLFHEGDRYTFFLLGTEVIGVEAIDTPGNFQPSSGYLPGKTFFFSVLRLGGIIVVVLLLALFVVFGVNTYFPFPL